MFPFLTETCEPPSLLGEGASVWRGQSYDLVAATHPSSSEIHKVRIQAQMLGEVASSTGAFLWGSQILTVNTPCASWEGRVCV